MAFGFQSDEATYYRLGAQPRARLGTSQYQRQDLVRVWKEFPTGPEGIFLKRGRTSRSAVSGALPVRRPALQPGLAHRSAVLRASRSPTRWLASPFVWLFGTNGFLLLHALLLTLGFGAAYAFLRARSAPAPALAWAVAFFVASAVPVYFVWLTPELFNLSLMLFGLFFWAYKEVAPPRGWRQQASCASPASTLIAGSRC